MQRLLVINVARYGDTLLTTPVFSAIKSALPDCELTVLAHPGRLEIIDQHPLIDHLMPFTKQRAIWRGWLPGQRFDAALVYGHDAELFRYAARVARRVIGFAQQDASLNTLLGGGVARPTAVMHAVDERLLLPQALGIPAAGRGLSYRITDQEADWAKNWLAERQLTGRSLIGLQLQSYPGKAYRDWPIAHFSELMAKIRTVLPECRFLLLGGADGQQSARKLAQQQSHDAISIAGDYSLRQSAALMARLALYVGVDTGPTHLAGALGIPMVALYHCFHRGRHLAPLEHPHLRIVEHPVDDAHCTRVASMSEIPVDQVFSEICTLLAAAK